MATADSVSKPTTLTLPAPIIATLSPRPYLLAHLQSAEPARPNGRLPSTFRTPSCTTSSLSHCAGSAVVRVGDTAVACGIQAELLYAKDIPDNSDISGQNHDRQKESREQDDTDQDTLERLQLLVPNIELVTGCSPQHLPGAGGPPSSLAQSLTHRLYRLLLSSRLVQLQDLIITHEPLVLEDDDQDRPSGPETVAYWTLYASLTVLSLSGTTSLLDALWACLLAALTDVKLPNAWWDPDREIILCSDLAQDASRLRLRGRPFLMSWGIFEGRIEDAYMNANGDEKANHKNASASERDSLFLQGKQLSGGRGAWFLADPDSFEDNLCHETVSIAVDCSSGKVEVLRVEKNGGGVVGVDELSKLVRVAAQQWKVWDGVLPEIQ